MEQLIAGSRETTKKKEILECTVGELISAIVDAAEEATIGQEHIADLTSVVFQDMMRRRK